jgi:hypothetical protein
LGEDMYSNRKRLYEHYAGMFPTRDIFDQVFLKVTENYGCMVINNRVRSTDIRKKVFWYRAKKTPEFMIGIPAFISWNKKNFDEEYDKKEQGLWNGCFGSMTAISYNFLKQLDEEFRLIKLIPHITKRVDRCAFERIIGCMLQYKCKKPSLFGHIKTNCDWQLDFNKYKNNMYNLKSPIIKVFTGR